MATAHRKLGRDAIACTALVALTCVAYYGTLGNGFVNFDDDLYVTANHHVQAGLTPGGVKWAFTTGHAANWHPLTWLSHMVDVEIFGLNPAGHHFTSLLLHALNGLLLYWLLRRTTGHVARSLFVAALFAVHPLHVESVAWVAERKDVLSTFFGLLALLAYARYARAPGVGRYLVVLVFFAAGLMAKPMLVTWPLLLLLLDYWPLARLSNQVPLLKQLAGPKRAMLLEKIPLFALAATSALVTLFVQRSGGAVGTIDRFPLGLRIANALLAYVFYVARAVVPVRLAVFYPYPQHVAAFGLLLGAIAILALATLGAWRARAARPYALVGWLWYLLTLAPVVGLIQFGGQAYADRYSYVPLIGVCIVLAWRAPELAAPSRPGRSALTVVAAVAVAVLIFLCRQQVGYWRDSETLWEHAVAVTTDNHMAHIKLGNASVERGRLDAAEAQYREALRIRPGSRQAHNNLASLRLRQGRYTEAVEFASRVLAVDPRHVLANVNMGIALASLSRIDEAVGHFERALGDDPECADAHFNLATAFFMQDDYAPAADHFAAALRIRPLDNAARFGLGAALFHQGNIAEAARHFEAVLAHDPGHAEAKAYLKRFTAARGRP